MQNEVKMKTFFLCLAALSLPELLSAQTDSTAGDAPRQLKEVAVKAARVVSRTDGLLFLPSLQQKTAAANAYDLLGALALPGIRVDGGRRTVSAINGKAVQVRLNGALATPADLLALDAGLIQRIEFIDNPGARYGADVGYVIDLRARRPDAGLALGADLQNAATTPSGSNAVFVRRNRKNAEWGLTYDFAYSDARGTRMNEAADYTLADASHRLVERHDVARRERRFANNLELKCSLADSAHYLFQATLTGDFAHSPTGRTTRRFAETGSEPALATRLRRSTSLSPVADLYFFHTLGRRQSLTANAVATFIRTREFTADSEGTAYAYHASGRTHSLTAEAVYENRLRPFTLSAGANYRLKYTHNIYSGDAEAVNDMHTANLYLFAQAAGNLWQKLRYQAGLGASFVRYRQGRSDYACRLFRPRVSLAYPLARDWSLKYSFEVAQHISQIAMVSDATIRTNSREWTVGNPDLKPSDRVTHDVSLSYTRPHLFAELFGEWRTNRHCNMAAYERTADGRFLYTQRNQPHVNMLYAEGYARLTLVPERLTVALQAGIFRYFNKGDAYNHCLTAYTLGGHVQAYWGRWTLTVQADNGWKFMEGETMNRQGMGNTLRCSYRWGGANLSLTWRHPFEAQPLASHARLVNRYLRKDMRLRTGDDGNLVEIGLAWRMNRGRTYRNRERTLQNADGQTGLL